MSAMAMTFGQRNGGGASGIGRPSTSASSTMTRPPPFAPPRIPPKSQTASANRQAHLPTLSQVVAMSLCYKRLFFVIFLLPIICVATPVLVNVLFAAMNSFTGGYGTICLVTTTLFTSIWYSVLKSVAPSPEKLQEAYEKSQFRLPVLMLIISVCLINTVASVTNARDLQPSMLQWAPTIGWTIGLRPAFGLLLLGIAVLLRFVGQASFVRCSTVPLVSNQYVNFFRSWLVELDVRVYRRMRHPFPMIEVNGIMTTLRGFGRRYQCPTRLSCAINLFFTVLLGIAVSETMLIPYWKSLQSTFLGYEESRKLQHQVDCTTIIVMVLQLMVTDFSGSSHELNPKRYYKPMTGSFFAFLPMARTVLWETLKQATICIMVTWVFAVAIVLARYGNSFWDFHMLLEAETLKLLFASMLASACVGLYVTVLEEASKAALCIPGSKLTRFVREVTGGDSNLQSVSMDDEKYLVDALLHSILHGNADLVNEVGAPNTSPSGVQRQETIRNKKAATTMAKVLLGDPSMRRASEASLEEDVLRHSILESLGGSKKSTTQEPKHDNKPPSDSTALAVAPKDTDLFPMDIRHRETIEYWMMETQHPRINKSTILVRALSAYTVGMGSALIECSEGQSAITTWLVRPGALVAAEYSVIAMARCIEALFQNARKRATLWTLTPESHLVAAALNSAYCLHSGIVQHARYLERIRFEPSSNIFVANNSVTLNNRAMISDSDVMKNHPDLKFLIVAIEHLAKVTMQQIQQATGSGLTATSIWDDLDDTCGQWLHRMS